MKEYITVKIKRQTLERYNFYKRIGMTWTDVLNEIMDDLEKEMAESFLQPTKKTKLKEFDDKGYYL